MGDQEDSGKISGLDAVGKWTDTGKNLFSLLRDAALFGLFFLLLGCPAILNRQLEKTGLTHFEGPGFRWNRQVTQSQDDSLAAVADISRVRNLTETALLDATIFANQNPAFARHMEPLRLSLARIVARLDRAGGGLDEALAKQQDVLDNAAPTPPPIQGWISTHPNVTENLAGDAIRVRNRPLRVRRGAGVNSPVIAVLPPRTEAQIVRRGTYPWAEVVRR